MKQEIFFPNLLKCLLISLNLLNLIDMLPEMWDYFDWFRLIRSFSNCANTACSNMDFGGCRHSWGHLSFMFDIVSVLFGSGEGGNGVNYHVQYVTEPQEIYTQGQM